MKLVTLKCPGCGATLDVNKELETATCNYCGKKIFIEDENTSKEERIIKTISKEIEKFRNYKSSEEYQKKLEIKHKEEIRSLKILGIVYGSIAIFTILLLIFGNLFGWFESNDTNLPQTVENVTENK